MSMRQEDKVEYIYTAFGKTKKVLVSLYNTTNIDEVEKELWVERPEDMYSLQCPQYKDAKVAIIQRVDWVRGVLCNG